MIDYTEITRIQDRAIGETLDLLKPGKAVDVQHDKNAVLIEAPTGAGKTRMNARTIEEFSQAFLKENGRLPVVLALQHRERLLEQAEAAFDEWNPDTKLTKSRCIDGNMDTTGNVTFGTSQTVAANLGALPKIDLLTIDEAHHASDAEGAEYTRIIDHIYEQNPEATMSVTTATSNRPDSKGLHPRIQNAPRVSIGYMELVRAGQINLPKTKEVDITTDDGRLTRSIMRDKFNPEKNSDPAGLNKQLKKLRPADYNEQMLDNWERHFQDTEVGKSGNAGTLVFESTIASARKFAEEAAARGHKVAVVDSEQSKDHNRDALNGLSNKDLDMIVSVKMIDEGVDIPSVRCVMINRETTSAIEYDQMVGRSVRKGSDPSLREVSPTVLDGGCSTMIHGSVERRAIVSDYLKKLEKGEIIPERNEDAKFMPKFGGDEYEPWRLMKEPPPVMAITDGKTSIYAVASKAPDGTTNYSLTELSEVRGRLQLTIMKDEKGKPLTGISAERLHQVEADRLLPSRHDFMRMETTSSKTIPGKSLVDERLAGHIDFANSAAAFAAAMSGNGR